MSAKIVVTGAKRPNSTGPASTTWDIAFSVESGSEGRVQSFATVWQRGGPRDFTDLQVDLPRLPDWVCQLSVAGAVRSYFRHQVAADLDFELPDGTLSKQCEVSYVVQGEFDESLTPWTCESIGPVRTLTARSLRIEPAPRV